MEKTIGKRKDLLWTCLKARGAGLACGYGRRTSKHQEGGLSFHGSPPLQSLASVLPNPSPARQHQPFPNPAPQKSGLRGAGQRLSLLTHLHPELPFRGSSQPPNADKSQVARTSDAEKNHDLMRPLPVKLSVGTTDAGLSMTMLLQGHLA